MSSNTERGMLVQVMLRATLLFVALNVLFALLNPLPGLGRISAYNILLPGRERLPFGEQPDQAYNLSLNNLEAMFASHTIAGTSKATDEYRVVLVGDSSVWGFLLENENTLSAQLNEMGLLSKTGKQVRFYNLGYPTISLTKDLLLIDHALRYEPDLIVWLTTLEAFPYEKQVFTPLVQNNPEGVGQLAEQYDLNIDMNNEAFVRPDFLESSIVGQRRPLADLLRLQAYGVMWAATGIDQVIPHSYTPRAEDLEAEEGYYDLTIGELGIDDIAFDVLEAGIIHAGAVPVLLVNEPMFVSQGENSDIRYNFFYPRWVYDAYRELLEEMAISNQWHYVDAWQAVDNSEYTNSAIHLTPRGSEQLAEFLSAAIIEITNQP